MKNTKTITILLFTMVILSVVATLAGILTVDGPGTFKFESIRGEIINIYGKGLYQHMSSDVAIQGIAQDFVTLFIAVPLLVFSFFRTMKGSLHSLLLLAGTVTYILVTYLFYLTMAMYNPLFLVYIILVSASFFTLFLILSSINVEVLSQAYSPKLKNRLIGGFLIFISFSIAILWLSMVIPPLLDKTIYPLALEHYTTLIVQGLDLSLLLPIAIVAGFMLYKKVAYGYLLAPVYFVFLSILMSALSAKLLAMGLHGVNIVPAIFIIPLFNILAIFCTYSLLTNLTPPDDNSAFLR